jgi:RimJ/RimL family protein N-acetyltransferase
MAEVAPPSSRRCDRTTTVHGAALKARALTMRPFLKENAMPYAALRVHPQVGRYLPAAPDVKQATKIARRLVAASRYEWRVRGHGLWAVFSAPDVFIGTCGLIWIEPLGRFELSFLFDPLWWGKGVARACVRTALSHADEVTPGLSVFAITHQNNRPAGRVLEATGFNFRANVRHAGLPAAFFERAENPRPNGGEPPRKNSPRQAEG